jgi:prepilin-type processing-associated H-X9-DG protein
MFAAENDDLLPEDGSHNGSNKDGHGWYNDLPQVLGLPCYAEMPWHTNSAIEPGRCLWICPANKRRSNGTNLFHYCLNDHVNGPGAHVQRKLTSVPRPALVVWLFDNGGLAGVAQQNNVHSNLHNGGANFTFLDGHSARFANREYWDFSIDRGRTNNPSLVWIP